MKSIFTFIQIFLFFSHVFSQEQIRIMTYNIRYDSKDDEKNNWGWNQRKREIVNFIKLCNPDILCVQEALYHQVQFLSENFNDFKWVGVGRDDGMQGGEFAPIFYNSKKFELTDKGVFWLNQYSNRVGEKGWDAACVRIVTWVKLKNRKTKKQFVHFNTHFDHIGKIARRESAILLMKKASEIANDLPYSFSGDFNCFESDEAYKIITLPNHFGLAKQESLIDSFYGCKEKFGSDFTFTGFPISSKPEGRIDYVFCSKKIKIVKHASYQIAYGTNYLSDHLPVVVDVEF